MKNALLWAGFVILTSRVFGAQQPVYTFVPTSLFEVRFDAKDCRHFDGSGVGCTKAVLRFKEMHLGYLAASDLDVKFLNEQGFWTMTVRFTPRACKPYTVTKGVTDGFLCAGVSWRARD